jgi:hypothetical protein
MARVHGIALIAIIAGGVGLWFLMARPAEVAPIAPPDATKPQPAGEPTAQSGDAPSRQIVDAPKPKAVVKPTTKPPEPQVADPAAVPNLLLRVRDVGNQQDLASFHWTLRHGAAKATGDGENGAASLVAPKGLLSALLVESEGYQPYSRAELLVPASLSEPLRVDVFMQPAMAGAGVQLIVMDTSQRPVTHIQVSAQRQVGASEPAPPPSWSRRGEAENGVYDLPQLDPGRYRLAVLAVDADGEILPLLPASRTVETTGSNAVTEYIELQPGCILTLELVDAAGAAVAPPADGPLSIRLQPRDQVDALTTFWRVGAKAERVEGRDALPAAGPATVTEPLPPGEYTITVAAKGQVRARTTLSLRGGERQLERILMP